MSIKDRINKSIYHHQFSNKSAKKQALKKENEAKLNQMLANPDDTDNYRKALRILARRQTGINLKTFGTWIIKSIACFIPPYLSYAWFQLVLNNTLLTGSINSKTLWGIQQQLLLSAIVTGALIVVCGIQLCKQGWYHRIYKRGELANKMLENLKKDEPQKFTNTPKRNKKK